MEPALVYEVAGIDLQFVFIPDWFICYLRVIFIEERTVGQLVPSLLIFQAQALEKDKFIEEDTNIWLNV